MTAPVSSETINEPRRPARIIVIILTTLLVIVIGLVGLWWFAGWRAARDRANWKGPALQRLAALSVTNEEIIQELGELKATSQPSFGFGWAGDRVLLMTNGEYIVFAFRHGANNGFVDHLFLGHGSNGKWLYSTYHFCNQMAGVSSEDPPGSIAEFEKRYAALEFDGTSDECLKHTWPPK
jgi:hypothetical protein